LKLTISKFNWLWNWTLQY